MIKKLITLPVYLLLLPVFFVLHGFLENYGFLSLKDAAMLLLSYLILSLCICVFSYFFFRDLKKAALITGIWMAFFFFFGAIHEFLKANSPIRFFSRYIFLIPMSTVILIGAFIFIKKNPRRFQRFTLFLNSLLLIYIAVDLFGILWKVVNPPDKKLSVYGFAKKSHHSVCDTCTTPDIYFLLFDEYASSISLKEKYNYHNDIDSFLIKKGFRIQSQSRSNYNFTAFSLSAILNMSYITGIKNVNAVTAEDYVNCNILIRDNEVIKFLDAHGYEIRNFSMFDLAGNPAMVEQSFLPLKTKLISDRTLFAHMNKDVGWILIVKFPFRLFSRNHFLKHLANNNLFLEKVKSTARQKQSKPRFVYAHFYLPHAPYFFDKNLQRKSNEVIYQEYFKNPPSAYLDYLPYTNQELRKLISTIQDNNPTAVIIILGDHGFRTATVDPNPRYYFQNINAVYYPDRNYQGLYDSITGVNQFRVVFNKLFRQSFPLLKDTSILLKDKK